MAVPVEVPALGESVTEAIIAEWLKKEGEFVEEDETLVELDTDKITVSVPAPVSGVVRNVRAGVDDTVNVGDVLAEIDPAASPAVDASQKDGKAAESAPQQAPQTADEPEEKPGPAASANADAPLTPAVRRLVDQHGVDISQIQPTGPGGRILKGDVLNVLEQPARQPKAPQAPASEVRAPARPVGQEPVERVKMSRLRQTVARRLVEAQQNSAMLTTFNEVDMTRIMELRKQYRDQFQNKYDTKLGFMSFFVKACINALKEFPAVNAEIDGDEIVYKYHYHIGVAVGGPRGLVVPVVRHADQLSFAEVENEISRLAKKAFDNQLSLADLQGGTFTISNGGIYGSMLSTPILNPPQVGILGMHNIVERPVAVNGKVEIRPIMYLALSYDHRIIDGKEAVSFLLRVRECLETPERILLEV